MFIHVQKISEELHDFAFEHLYNYLSVINVQSAKTVCIRMRRISHADRKSIIYVVSMPKVLKLFFSTSCILNIDFFVNSSSALNIFLTASIVIKILIR